MPLLRIFLAVVVLFFASCSGGGSGDNVQEIQPVIAHNVQELTLSDIVGVYELVDFTVVFFNGQEVTPEDVDSFSGVFTITQDVSTQRITINGVTTRMQAHITLLSNTSLLVEDGTSGCKNILEISFEKPILTTLLSMQELERCAGNFSETDVWERVN